MLYGNNDVEINCLILLLNSRLTMLLGSLSHVFIVGSNAGQTTFRGKVDEYWLPTPFACFPFTSPPVRHCVPPGSERAIHYNPRHVSSNTLLILRRSNFIVTASGIVTLRKQLFSASVKSGLSALNRCTEWRVTIPDAVTIQFDLLKMSMVLLETCRWL